MPHVEEFFDALVILGIIGSGVAEKRNSSSKNTQRACSFIVYTRCMQKRFAQEYYPSITHASMSLHRAKVTHYLSTQRAVHSFTRQSYDRKAKDLSEIESAGKNFGIL